MAYSPLEQGALANHKTLTAIAERRNATFAQVALAWVLRQDGVLAIPKAGSVEHVRENHRALELRLAPEDLKELDQAFPPPTRKTPLEMI
jgi:diketogulonate reductase-like aldo/keto reductase